MVGEGFEPSKA